MKKTLILCAAALELVSLSACGSKADPDKPQVAETKSVEERRAIAKKIRENSLKANRPVKYARPLDGDKEANAKASALRGVLERRRHGPFDRQASARFAPARPTVDKKANTGK